MLGLLAQCIHRSKHLLQGWPGELSNLFCFLLPDKVLDILCWPRWAGCHVLHVCICACCSLYKYQHMGEPVLIHVPHC